MGIEAVGLWHGRRWAEYLTVVEVTVLVPVGIYELTLRVSPLKVLTLLINLDVVAYLLITHRLFGIRGRYPADQAERDRDTGWEPLSRVTPWGSGAEQSGQRPVDQRLPYLAARRSPFRCREASHAPGGKSRRGRRRSIVLGASSLER